MSNENKRVLITSALPYVNNIPHLGNIVGSVLSADVFARYSRLRGYETLYVCGADEYGTATETKAMEEKMTCEEVCSKYYEIHKNTYEWFQISFDVFGRTTNKNHIEITQEVFRKLYEKGFLKEKEIEQFFCNHCSMFLADRFVEGICYLCQYVDARGDQCDGCGKPLDSINLLEPKCKICEKSPFIKKTSHLFLDLSSLQPTCEVFVENSSQGGFVCTENGKIKKLEKEEKIKWSKNSFSITRKWLKEGLSPRCITRDLKWGVPVPKCDGLSESIQKKVLYVWFDAPIGYVSITATAVNDWSSWWKKENVLLYQFMGKDNVPFHSVMFPSSLIGTSEKWVLPYLISATEYLSYEGQKFSKSRGIGVFGTEAKETGIPCSVWRYYLLSIRPETSDSVFNWDELATKCNNELIANLGNFINRISSFISKRTRNILPGKTGNCVSTNLEESLIKDVESELGKYIEAMEATKISSGLKHSMNVSSIGNSYLTNAKLGVKLLENDPERCSVVLKHAANVSCLLSTMLFPFIPETSYEIFKILNIKKPLLGDKIQFLIEEGHVFGTPKYLFKRIDNVEILKTKFGGS